jgi:hypothetical protein
MKINVKIEVLDLKRRIMEFKVDLQIKKTLNPKTQ